MRRKSAVQWQKFTLKVCTTQNVYYPKQLAVLPTFERQAICALICTMVLWVGSMHKHNLRLLGINLSAY